MDFEPSTTGGNGRGQGGRFGAGNRFGKGNPHAKRVARLRSAMLKSVSPRELHEVVMALLGQAKGGDVAAAKELFQRLLGPPEAIDLLERLDALAKIEQFNENRGQAWRH